MHFLFVKDIHRIPMFVTHQGLYQGETFPEIFPEFKSFRAGPGRPAGAGAEIQWMRPAMSP